MKRVKNNHTPTSMNDWARLSMHETSTTKCVPRVNMLEIVKVMAAQLTALQSEVSTLTKKIEKLSEKPTSTQMNLSYSDAATLGRSQPAPPSLPTTHSGQQYQQHKPPPPHQQQRQQQPKPQQSQQEHSKRNPRQEFNPNKCLIIQGDQNTDFSSVTQDDVRQAIVKASTKPVLIDFINTYKFSSAGKHDNLTQTQLDPSQLDLDQS